ncbi:hypothetical protein LTR78_006667 [Recurvomyces mirabilis]|uniref:Rhodopsin domain-containing protein n=1 Tax=Recurvomyces mirabilis TaxID=574656 RepID=A0AAE1BZN3_9PEZI|nr:hypothetical protein LTR78_006667 [Recurvomyces mirabilis]KAK5151444.1 hypothetical protein LTS14_009287 [Recurvomyces mirabilis]
MGFPFTDNAPNLAAVVIVLFIASAIVFPLRIYIRLSKKVWGVDDWMIVAAVLPFIAFSSACLSGSFHGIGVRQERLTDDQAKQGLKVFFLFEILWCITVIPTKLAISFQLARIAGPKQFYVYILWAMSAIQTIVSLVALFYIIFRCKPVSYAWNTSTPGGHCEPASTLTDIYYAATAINIVFDYGCSILPIPLLWSLQMNANAKITVAILLSLGVLASLSACVRLKYTVALTNATDYLYSISNVVIWGYAEIGVGFFVACAATLRPLVRRFVDLRASSDKRSRQDHLNALPEDVQLASRLGGHENGWYGELKQPKVSTSEERLVPQGQEIVISKSVQQSSAGGGTSR